ncbi:hypothetical protein KJ830_04250 [bacterium]|nr:hypothetical protein [bacterium]
MEIPRKPTTPTDTTIGNFIKKGTMQIPSSLNGEKKGRRIISLSLMDQDVEWLNMTVKDVNAHSERKIARSEVVAATFATLKGKNIEELLKIIKNR